ncbi:MAG: FeoB-associated Cys-rich membrane protein [Ruminococcus sp.]|nr:FeoB-associated Cys-rich membrane protein [Ruminococcus sp.]
MGTALVSIVLLAIVAGIIRGMIRDRKNGKSIQCGGDCKYCGGHCERRE